MKVFIRKSKNGFWIGLIFLIFKIDQNWKVIKMCRFICVHFWAYGGFHLICYFSILPMLVISEEFCRLFQVSFITEANRELSEKLKHMMTKTADKQKKVVGQYCIEVLHLI